jgi:hypothetical protein
MFNKLKQDSTRTTYKIIPEILSIITIKLNSSTPNTRQRTVADTQNAVGKKDVKACVDHYETSFKSILDTFCSVNNIIVSETK